MVNNNIEEKDMLKHNEKKRNIKPNNKAYMSSYDWNYLVLEIVDYIENNLSGQQDGEDSWKNFQSFCSLKYLNWRVIKKMIEYSLNQAFINEWDLIGHEAFKPLEIETPSTNNEEALDNSLWDESSISNFVNDEPKTKAKPETYIISDFDF
jgi:hypothetical protein